MVELFLNGKYVGDVENPREFVQQTRAARRSGVLDNNLNIAYHPHYDHVVVETGKGRLRRPLIVVQNGQSLLTEKHVKQLQKKEVKWGDLVNQGIIEFLDAEEEENAFISFSEEDLTHEHTHLEITPLAMLGLCTSLVPYGNFTQSARLSIGSKNQKQSLGFYASNFAVRMDMEVNLLHPPQIPVVTTVMHEISH